MEADPNDAVAAFTEYAADRLWVASHLTQLAGVAMMVGALICLAQQLGSGSGRGWARLAAGGAIAGLAVTTALQAVDGIALKAMVDAWADAPAAQLVWMLTVGVFMWRRGGIPSDETAV
jgi:hypothetical protein